jgi:hypothetical protein
MRAIRTWGSVRGVPGDWHPYRDPCGDATRAPTQGRTTLRVRSILPSVPNIYFLLWDGRKAINPSSWVSRFVEPDPFCSFVRAIQYAINFGMILFRARVAHSPISLQGHGAAALTRASTKERFDCR